ncbi:site-2 protease family protein [Candidatus Micrarchaeota archaeon]|nr:site-2 protease family protein [Candidatus Micrarchaeota archaeon]
MILVLAITAIALGIFYAILQLDIPGAWKFMAVVIEMVLVSQIFIRKYKLPSELGMVLVKSKKGIEVIEGLAKKEKAFNFFADVGAGISYGLLSLVLMRKNSSAVTLLLGLVILFFLTVFVAPVSLAFVMNVAKIGGVEKSAAVLGGSAEAALAITGGLLLVGGLFLFILFGIVAYGGIVLSAIFKTLFMGMDTISQTSAGGTFLLPGVNLPLFEGIIALAIVLIVHEGAHAVLTRIAKVPLLSSGIVLFGIIPVGAFVEPDEKKLARVERTRQTRVLVAGPSANMVVSAAIFILFMAFFIGTAQFREEGYLVLAGMEPGTVIHAINGEPVNLTTNPNNFSSFGLPKNGAVNLLTNKGEIIQNTDENGGIEGIIFTVLKKNSLFAVYNVPLLGFIYTTLGLALALNFLVGAVNILPIPLFDGYRIIDVNVKNKLLVKTISYGALFFFILNFLPLLFR